MISTFPILFLFINESFVQIYNDSPNQQRIGFKKRSFGESVKKFIFVKMITKKDCYLYE